MRFHLFDRVEEVCYGKFITAIKNVTFADDVFEQHFPKYPVFPGSLIMEGFAQLGGMFLELMRTRNGLPFQSAFPSVINKMKFRKPVIPGDTIMMRVDVVSFRDDFGVIKVKAETDGEVCADGEMTFIFMDSDDADIPKMRMELYDLWLSRAREVE